MTKHQPGSRWAVLKWFTVVDPDGDPFLKRLRIVQTPWFGVYLHFILAKDPDQPLHDHPWNFRSFILRGGYTELWRPAETSEINTWRRIWKRWTTHDMRATDAHRITHVEPGTITLVTVSKKHRQWGFHTKTHGWMPWDQYLVDIEGRVARTDY